jgi:hypothetical protein
MEMSKSKPAPVFVSRVGLGDIQKNFSKNKKFLLTAWFIGVKLTIGLTPLTV